MTEENQTPRAKLAAALAKAQGEFKPVAKNRAVQIRMKEGGTYKFEYADLEQLISCTRPALANHGLAVVQIITDGELLTSLIHADGGEITSRVKLPVMGQDPKAFGAACTYVRRYAYAALLCLAADDDLDEDGQDPEQQRPAPRSMSGPAPRAEQPPADSADATQGEINWLKNRLGKLDTQVGLDLLAKHQVPGLDAGLTKVQFAALKADLLKA